MIPASSLGPSSLLGLGITLGGEDLETEEALCLVVEVRLAQVGNTRLANLSVVWLGVVAVTLVERALGTGIRIEGSDLACEVGRQVDASVDGKGEFLTCAGEVGTCAGEGLGYQCQ